MFSNSQLSKIIPAQGLGRLLPTPWSNCDTPMWTQPTRWQQRRQQTAGDG